MKIKTTLLFVISLMILSPSIISTNASTYTVDIDRNPIDVYEGELVTLSVTVFNMTRDEEITSARLSCFFNGVFQPSIASEQDLPMRESYLTFVIGPFITGDVIRYKVYLEFMESENYGSDWYDFTIQGGSRPLLTAEEWSFVIIAAALTIAVAVYVIYKIRGRKT